MSIAGRLRTVVGLPAVLALVLTIPTFAHAQTTSASVSGIVQDAQGEHTGRHRHTDKPHAR